MPEEGFFRAGRTRPGPNVHGPRPGRTGGGSSRRPRWDTDAGITDRDVAALRWLGQQYAARADVLRVLLGRLSPGTPRIAGQLGDETLRQILDRWEDRGLIARDRLLGFLWVAPTVKALRLVGLDVRAWSFVIPQLAHVHAVGVVRLGLEPSIPQGGCWLSERELRREAGKSHVPDAAIQLPDDPEADAGAGLYGEDVDPLPKRVAVEVELTRRGAARLREAWTRPRHGRWVRTVYYAPPEVASYLTGQLGSFAVLSLLYRAEVSAEQATAGAEVAPNSTQIQRSGAKVLTKRAQAERAYADLSAEGAPVSAARLAAAAGLSASYARALLVQLRTQPPTALQRNGRRPVPADADPEARP